MYIAFLLQPFKTRILVQNSLLNSGYFVVEKLILNASIKVFFVSYIFILEIFNTNILHQLFDYKITFVNSQHENTNSKG